MDLGTIEKELKSCLMLPYVERATEASDWGNHEP